MDDIDKLSDEQKKLLDLGHDPERWNERLHSKESSWTGPLRFISKIANSWFGKTVSIIAIFTLVLISVMNSIMTLGIHIWFW